MQMSRSIKRKRAKLASARAKPHTESTHKVNPNAKIQHGKLSDQPDVDALRLDLKKPDPYGSEKYGKSIELHTVSYRS